MSQNLIEDYLLEHVQEEYEKFHFRNIHTQNRIRKKKGRDPQQVKAELERLNLLFQKGRVSYEYYEKEYDSLEKELQTVNIIPLPAL